MRVLPSRLDTRADDYTANRAAMQGLLDEVRAQQALLHAGGGEKYVARHRERGKLLAARAHRAAARPRLRRSSSCRPLAGWGTDVPGRRRRGHRHRRRRGRRVRDHRQRPDRQGRRDQPADSVAQEACARWRSPAPNRLPLVNLIESGGADLPTQAEIFVPGGAVFRDLTRLSPRGHPDHRAGLRQLDRRRRLRARHVRLRRDGQSEAAKVFLGGPPLVKMATGEDADDETLGGAEMHARVAAWPTTSPPTSSTRSASAARSSRTSTGASSAPARDAPPTPPAYDPDELLGIASADVRRSRSTRAR